MFHFLTIIPISGVLNIDFVTYIPTGQTPVNGRDVLVDDRHPLLQYSGHWVQMDGNLPSGVGYQNTVSSSNRTTASVSYFFYGEFVCFF